mmetsp:Transcript_799/g.1721  ORF Transcript_799/g.1721 Transcript_799/m.1721 type:complete len:549 (-) Transcript_799:76-1722(-)
MRTITAFPLLFFLVHVVVSSTTHSAHEVCLWGGQDSILISSQHSSVIDRCCSSVWYLRGGGDVSHSMPPTTSLASSVKGFPGIAFLFGPRPPERASLSKCPSKDKQSTCSRQTRDQKLRLPSWLSWLFRPGSRKTEDFPDPASAVMLQGFDWELLSTRSELYKLLHKNIPSFAAAGFNVIWYPPPSASADAQGYLPGRWYDIPQKKELQRSIEQGEKFGIISMVDVVLNHRTGSKISNQTFDWTRFEQPDWEEWAIVQNDWKCPPEEHLKYCPANCTCGGVDTGENACFAPDIDHTSPRVQADIEAWLTWLQEAIGFQAFRFDNTKGYAGKFVAQYIDSTQPYLSVGEFFDTNRNLLESWIKDSQGKAKTFDFGLRYKLKDAIHQDEYSHLMDTFFGPMLWYAADSSVSFLDNHDTAGLLKDRFGNDDQIAMGYAFILTHPSVPCVFWQDWFGSNQRIIRDLIAIRQQAGITSHSSWKVDVATKGLYAGYVGDSLAVKLGGGEWSPNAGKSTREWERGASGKNWCVWVRTRSAGKDKVEPLDGQRFIV